MQSNILGAELAPFAPESRRSQVNRQPDHSEVFSILVALLVQGAALAKRFPTYPVNI